jgi:GTP-binding protein
MQWYNTSMKRAMIMKAQFISSSAHFAQLPAPQGNEFCVMGRSNVGKSSFINHVFENRGLARVSKKPGKTTLANCYAISDGSTWIDLPGYGFANAPKGEQVRWNFLIEEYCEKRTNLRGCIWLLDIRHAGLPVDMQAMQWFNARKMHMFPVLTKSDKLSKQEIAKRMTSFMQLLGLSEAPLCYSITRPACREEFWTRFKHWQSSCA